MDNHDIAPVPVNGHRSRCSEKLTRPGISESLTQVNNKLGNVSSYQFN